MHFDLDDFRLLYKEFSDSPDAQILAIAAQSECFLPKGCCESTLATLSMLLVAHQLDLKAKTAAGGGLALASAGEGSVSVSLAIPAGADAWGQWLNITAYGQQYAAIAAKCGKGRAASGIYIGGFPEADAFRRVYGLFTRLDT